MTAFFGPTTAQPARKPWWMGIREREALTPQRPSETPLRTLAHPVDAARLENARARGRVLHRMASEGDAIRRATAHECGHAVALFAFDLPIGSVEIGRYGHGNTTAARIRDPEKAAIVAAAGPMAEEMYFGTAGDGDSDDEVMLAESGYDPWVATRKAEALIVACRPLIDGLGEVLRLSGGNMSGQQVETLLDAIDVEISPGRQRELRALRAALDAPDDGFMGPMNATPAPDLSVADLSDLVSGIAELIDAAMGGDIIAGPDLIAALQAAIAALQAAKPDAAMASV